MAAGTPAPGEAEVGRDGRKVPGGGIKCLPSLLRRTFELRGEPMLRTSVAALTGRVTAPEVGRAVLGSLVAAVAGGAG